jgi:hypothetical protein
MAAPAAPQNLRIASGSINQGGVYRSLAIDAAANPFGGPPEQAYGGSKHVWFVWHPVKKRVYTWGGDFGVGAGAFSQPEEGANFTTSDPGRGNTYERSSSLCNDQYSIDPYATGSIAWRLEHPYLPRNMSGSREVRPGRPDQVSLVWDSLRSKLWGLITTLRTEFLYLTGGVPDLWANGDMSVEDPFEPNGTWSFVPGASGSPGAWVLETANRIAYRSGVGTSYSGGVLITGAGDERIANWEYDPRTDTILSWGWGRIFIFKPATMTFEHRVFSPSAYSGYFNPCSSYVGILGDWMYGVVLAQESGGTRRSLLVRVNITNLLALANGGTVGTGATNYQAWVLPWSLSPGNVWETDGDASAKWQEHAGVSAADGRIAVVKSYDHLYEDGVTKFTLFNPVTLDFLAATESPEAGIAANSWVALPDTGEILFGLNTSGYTDLKLWAYQVYLAATKLASGKRTLLGSDPGSDTVAWDSALLTKQRMLINWCVGDHGPDSSNAVRGFNPQIVAVNDSTGVSRASHAGWYRFPWTEVGGVNQYVSQYDNQCHIYDPVTDRLITLGRGVFDLTTAAWIYGDRSPLDSSHQWDDYIGGDTDVWMAVYPYNPVAAWIPELDKAIILGGKAGGASPTQAWWALTRGGAKTMTLTFGYIPNDMVIPLTAKNCSVVVGTDLYFGCQEWRDRADTTDLFQLFYKLDCRNMVYTRLTDWPDTFALEAGGSGYYTLSVYDSKRNRIIMLGWKVWSYSLSMNTWTDITPDDWVPLTHAMGAYIVELDAVVYRGGILIIPDGANSGHQAASDGAESVKWYQLALS